METLGNAGNIYLTLLFLFMIGGLGLFSLGLARNFWNKTEDVINKKGGAKMNQWLKVAAVSFVGVIIASFALGLVSNSSSAGGHGASGGAGGGHGTQQTVQSGMMGMMAGGTQSGSVEQQIQVLQYNLMQMQLQMQQMMQQHAGGMASQNMGMGGMNMNGMMNMNQGMGNMSGMSSGGSSGGGGMGMM